MRFQIVVGALIVCMLARLVYLYVKGRTNKRRLGAGLIFWSAVLLAVIFHEETNKLAHFFNITRGADFLIYMALIAIFYVLFRIFERLETIERNMTTVVRRLALDDKERGEK